MPENMTSKSSVFPQELLDMILENLSTDGRSLSSCSLVSRDWFSPARRVHFRDTRITKTGKYVIDGTLTAFLSSSSVGRYILKLRLECSVRNFGLLELNHLSFASLLPFLPSLRFLSLTRIVWFDSTPESNVPTTLPNVSPPLQELTLDRSLFYTARESSPIPLLVDLLTLFPPLRHIRILNPAITPNHPVSQDLRPILSTFNTSSSVLRALQLESATFFTPYLHIFFAILTASGSMGTLQSLDASCFNPLHISRLQSFINNINLTLKHIRIVWPKSFPGDPNYDRKHSLPLDLSKCTALRTLHLRLQAFVEKNELHTQWLLTLDTLAHIPPTLENIIITLRLCHASQTPPNIEETILTRLDQILDHFTTLRILSIYPDICISDNGTSVVHPFSIGQQQAISAHLTRLSRKGILHFDVYHIAHCGYCRSCPPDEARSVSSSTSVLSNSV